MLKIERDELSAQLATVENILSTLPENDYVGRISFEARREEIEEKQKLRGTLLGVIPYSRRFEFIPDETGRVIKGTVADSFSKTYLDKMQTQQYSGRRWNASFVRKSVRKMGRDPIDHYTLLDLGELEEQAGFVTLANMPESKAEKEPAS
jgi:hypothetical protein